VQTKSTKDHTICDIELDNNPSSGGFRIHFSYVQTRFFDTDTDASTPTLLWLVLVMGKVYFDRDYHA
jgi:hypothetical protein